MRTRGGSVRGVGDFVRSSVRGGLARWRGYQTYPASLGSFSISTLHASLTRRSRWALLRVWYPPLYDSRSFSLARGVTVLASSTSLVTGERDVSDGEVTARGSPHSN